MFRVLVGAGASPAPMHHLRSRSHAAGSRARCCVLRRSQLSTITVVCSTGRRCAARQNVRETLQLARLALPQAHAQPGALPERVRVRVRVAALTGAPRKARIPPVAPFATPCPHVSAPTCVAIHLAVRAHRDTKAATPALMVGVCAMLSRSVKPGRHLNDVMCEYGRPSTFRSGQIHARWTCAGATCAHSRANGGRSRWTHSWRYRRYTRSRVAWPASWAATHCRVRDTSHVLSRPRSGAAAVSAFAPFSTHDRGALDSSLS